MFEWIKKLLERLRGRKRSHKEILRAHNRAIKPAPTIKSAPIAPQVNYEPPIEQPQEEISGVFVLDIQNGHDMEKYLAVLNNLRGFENFSELNWLRAYLDKIRKDLSGISAPEEFDGEFNFNLAKKVRAVAKNVLKIYHDAINSTNLNETSRRQICAAAEDYLEKIGLTKKIFNVGDSGNDWADLGMEEGSQLMTSTKDRRLDSTIAKIEIQPHTIFYRGEDDDTEHLNYFGGICRIYKFKED